MSEVLQNRKLVLAFSVFYVLVLIYLLFFAFFREGTTTRVNLIPFDSIIPLTVYTFKTGEDWWHWFVNVPGNILAFIPMAVPLKKFVRHRVSKPFFLGLIILIPCIAEFLQLVFKTGSCDVDDVLLNVAGISMGILLSGKNLKQPVP